MRRYTAQDPGAPLFVFGHGAGTGHDHPWSKRVASELASRGISVVTFDFPYIAAGRKIPDNRDVLEAAFRAVWTEAQPLGTGQDAEALPQAAGPRLFAGGKSMGGRIASQVTARGALDPPPDGLVFFGYPLHPPGKPEQRRDRHLFEITQPMLFLHGTRDPFGSPDEMTALIELLPAARLELIDGGDHGLLRLKRQDPAGTSLSHAIDMAAHWMLAERR